MKAQEFIYATILELKDIEESELNQDLTIDALTLDSLDYVEIQIGIKKNFAVDINPELFLSGQIKTLGDLTAYIEKNAAGVPA